MKFIKSVLEEFQIVTMGRKYLCCGEEYNVEKRKVGSNIIFPIILRLLGRISSKRTEIMRKKMKI